MEKVIGLLKDELAGKMTKEFHGLKAKSYSYLTDDVSDDKSRKHRKCIIKNDVHLKILKTTQQLVNLKIK